MDLCNELCLSGQPADCPDISLAWQKLGYYMQTIQPNFFIPAILIGTIDFYHFVSLLTLTSPRGHKVSMKLNLLASFSPTLFISSG